jgi:tRNA threonylcarbamoyladenosine biosynthesis protein TsaE
VKTGGFLPASSESYTTKSPEETFSLGVRIGETLKGGEVLLLSGELGAGKTLLARGIAEGLGADPNEVTSPSFTLVNRYEGRLAILHVDLYRLADGPEAAYAVDLDELLSEESAVLLIEWGERLGDYPLPSSTRRITITGDGDDARTITIGSP